MRRQRTGMQTLHAAGIVVFAAGCGATAPEATSSTGAAWDNATVVEELSIGVDVGAEEYMFGGIEDLDVGTDGSIYVRQSQPVSIRQYDRDGTFVRDIGGEGQGPGEYQYPEIEVLGDGRVAVLDLRSNRLSLFGLDGEYEDSVSLVGNTAGPESLHVDRDDNFYVRAFGELTGQEAEIPIELRKYSLEGELLDTLSTPPSNPEGSDFTLAHERFKPFTVLTQWTWSPLGYMVVGRNDRYDVELRKDTGTVHLRRELEPASVNDDEMAEWQAFRQRYIELNTAAGIEVEGGTIPWQKPFFRQLHAAEDGRIWLHRYVDAVKREDIEPIPDQPERPLLTWREPSTYDVFEPDGTFLGTVVLPPEFQPRVFRGEQVWGVRMDEDGIEQVARLRVIVQ